MSWQIAILLNLFFAAGFGLVQRSVSKQFISHSRVAPAFMYAVFVSPIGIIYGLLNYHISFSFPLFIWIFLVIAGILFGIANVAAYRSNAHIDAAQFAVLNNLLGVFTVIIAAIFLSERMSSVQLVGVTIVIAAAALVSVNRTTKRTFKISRWSLLAIASALIAAMAISFEKYLLGHMNVGTYMIIGWGFQTIAMVAIATGKWHTLKDFDKIGLIKLSSLGIFRALQGITFVVAISQANVGLLTSITSYSAVLIFIGGLIFLGEKTHIIIRLFGSVLATIGLLLIFS